MADETPQEAQATAAPAAAGGAAAEAPQSSGGFMAYLPLILAVVLMPGLALGTFKLKSMMDKPVAAASAEPEAPVAEETSSGGHGATEPATKPGEWNRRLAVPLTRLPIAFKPADKTKPGDQDKFVVLDLKGDPKDVAQADKIVVNLARTSGMRYAVARVSLMSDHADFIDRLNLNRERLIDVASGALSAKTLDEIEVAGFRNLLRAELLAGFNRVLGGNIVKEVIIEEFIVQ